LQCFPNAFEKTNIWASSLYMFRCLYFSSTSLCV
jgi:hypothetical protein